MPWVGLQFVIVQTVALPGHTYSLLFKHELVANPEGRISRDGVHIRTLWIRNWNMVSLNLGQYNISVRKTLAALMHNAYMSMHMQTHANIKA